MRADKSGCELFVHHFETVDGLTFNCSHSHLFVLFFSANTTFRRFMSVSFSMNFVILVQDSENPSFGKITIEVFCQGNKVYTECAI